MSLANIVAAVFAKHPDRAAIGMRLRRLVTGESASKTRAAAPACRRLQACGCAGVGLLPEIDEQSNAQF